MLLGTFSENRTLESNRQYHFFAAYSEEDVGRSIKGVISCNTDQCSDYLKVFFKQNLFQEDILRKRKSRF